MTDDRLVAEYLRERQAEKDQQLELDRLYDRLGQLNKERVKARKSGQSAIIEAAGEEIRRLNVQINLLVSGK